jgi:hypothetical protein
MLIFYFMLVNFVGTSCWFFYEWRMGMETPVIFGFIISVIIVSLAFPRFSNTNVHDFLSNNPAVQPSAQADS